MTEPEGTATPAMDHDTELVCRELVEVITDYLEGALSERDRARFEAHLATCDGCTTYLEQMRLTIRMTGHLSEDAIPAEVKTKLLQVYRAWKGA